MIYPTMVLRLLPTGLLGIMLSALLAALTSTLSAILNSTSTLFTMDFYAKIDKRADERKLVRVGKLASLVIIVIAALWAPQIGRFGSLLKYYQEMLSYIAPPVVAAFLMGVFSRRANGRGAFAGLRDALSADRAVPAGLQPVGDLGRKPYGSRAPARQTDRHDLFGGGFPG